MRASTPASIIEQAVISPAAIDSYMSYPYLQIAAALPLLAAADPGQRQGRTQDHHCARALPPSGITPASSSTSSPACAACKPQAFLSSSS
jgi:hypothetical protein